MSGIYWTEADVNASDANPDYPFLSLVWGSPEAIDRGCGVMKSDISAVGSFWIKDEPESYIDSTREGSLMDMSIWSSLYQVLLAIPGGASMQMFSDNVECKTSANVDTPGCDLVGVVNGLCPMRSYLTCMLRKTPYPGPNPFSYDRFCLRTIPPPPFLNFNGTQPASYTGQSLPLPLRRLKNSDKCRDVPFTAWPVIPPLGYKNLGVYIERTTYVTSSPGTLLFVLGDARFVQPPGPLLAWSAATFGSWGYFQAQYVTVDVRTDIPSPTTAGKTVPVKATYRYRTVLDMIWNQLVWAISPRVAGQITTTSAVTYSSVLPWALNTQLMRVFPDAPENFTGLPNPMRTVFDAGENCGVAVQSGLDNRRFHLLAANPTVHIVGSRISTTENPLVIFLSFSDLLQCCAGIYQFTKFDWDLWAYALPVGTTGLTPGTASPGRVICMAQNWEWNMQPDGTTCDKITTAICNPSSKKYWDAWMTNPDVSISCACINTQGFVELLFGAEPVGGYPKPWQSSIETFKTYIQCFSTQCRNNPRALKKSTNPPYDGTKCPDLTTCIIDNINLDSKNLSPVTIINNCGGTLPTDDQKGVNDEDAGALGNLALVFCVVAVFCVLIGAFVILLMRRRRSRRIEERERRAESRRRDSSREESRKSKSKSKSRRRHKDYGEDEDDDYEDSSEEDY